MRKSDIKEIKELFRSSEYISRINGNPFEAGKKLSSFKTAAFYAGFLNIVLDARRMAVKGQYSREELIRSSFQVIHNLEKLGAQFEVKGLDNLRKDSEPVVIAGNHMSTLETTAFPCIVGTSRDCTFVVKRSLVTNSVFGPVMRSLDPIDVERKDPRRDLDSVLTKGVELLEKGISVILFPQATRKAGFDPETFNSLGVKLAKRAGVITVPRDDNPIDPRIIIFYMSRMYGQIVLGICTMINSYAKIDLHEMDAIKDCFKLAPVHRVFQLRAHQILLMQKPVNRRVVQHAARGRSLLPVHLFDQLRNGQCRQI